MKTTLDLPDELVREMKLRAVIQGRTLRDLVADLLRQGLGLSQSKATALPPIGSAVTLTASGLPVAACAANAPALRMALADLLALEQQAQTQEDAQRAGHSV